jgi:hypothetical protein
MQKRILIILCLTFALCWAALAHWVLEPRSTTMELLRRFLEFGTISAFFVLVGDYRSKKPRSSVGLVALVVILALGASFAVLVPNANALAVAIIAAILVILLLRIMSGSMTLKNGLMYIGLVAASLILFFSYIHTSH